MKPSFVLSILFAVCVNASLFATENVNDTIYIKCSRQVDPTITSMCSCQPDSSVINTTPHIPNANTIPPDSLLTDTSIINPDSFSDFVSFITFIVNDFNNILTEINNSFALISIIIGVFGLLIGVLGILGFSNLKNDYRELKREIVDYESDIQEKIEELDDLTQRQRNMIAQNQSRLNYQSQYLQRINQYLFLVTNSVVDINGGDNGTASSIRNVLYNQYYIVKVFLPWSDSPTDGTEAAFRYLKTNGTEDNIDDLQFIADNDSEERKRRMAQETIGYIRARLMSDPS